MFTFLKIKVNWIKVKDINGTQTPPTVNHVTAATKRCNFTRIGHAASRDTLSIFFFHEISAPEKNKFAYAAAIFVGWSEPAVRETFSRRSRLVRVN